MKRLWTSVFSSHTERARKRQKYQAGGGEETRAFSRQSFGPHARMGKTNVEQVITEVNF